MIEFDYSLVIEETEDPEFCAFYSPDLPGFTGAARNVSDCIRTAAELLSDYLIVSKERGAQAPPPNPCPSITIVRFDPQREQPAEAQ